MSTSMLKQLEMDCCKTMISIPGPLQLCNRSPLPQVIPRRLTRTNNFAEKKPCYCADMVFSLLTDRQKCLLNFVMTYCAAAIGLVWQCSSYLFHQIHFIVYKHPDPMRWVSRSLSNNNDTDEPEGLAAQPHWKYSHFREESLLRTSRFI